MTTIDAFPETATQTVDQPVRLSLIVHPPADRASDKVFLAKLVRERLLEILDFDGLMGTAYEDDAELATRLTVDDVEIVREYRVTEQKELPERIAEHLQQLLAEVPEEDRPDAPVRALLFGTDTWDNGVFFADFPELILANGRRLDWIELFEKVGGEAGASMDEFTPDMTDAFGPVGHGDWLLVDLDAGMAFGSDSGITDRPLKQGGVIDGIDDNLFEIEQTQVSQLKQGDSYRWGNDTEWVPISEVREEGDDIIVVDLDGDEASFDRSVGVLRLRQPEQEGDE